VELLVTYEGSPIAVSDLRLLMDTLVLLQFTGSWRRLFSKVKKHIIWSVLKSVTGMQVTKLSPGSTRSDFDIRRGDWVFVFINSYKSFVPRYDDERARSSRTNCIQRVSQIPATVQAAMGWLWSSFLQPIRGKAIELERVLYLPSEVYSIRNAARLKHLSCAL
jgi:hypothetical protein